MGSEMCIRDRMRQGDVVLIYMKKHPKEIRNYRPITLYSTVTNIQNTDNNPCLQTEQHMRGSDIQATEGICPWETNNRPHPPSVPHTRIRRQFRRRCTANIHVEATQRHVSGSNTRKCMHLRGSKVVWREFYTLPPHIYADYCPRDILLLAKQ